MVLFAMPPVISRDLAHRVSVEGSAGPDERETLEHAVETFGPVILPGERLTGAQWCNRIERSHDRAQPAIAEGLRTIRAVMLTEQFKDDFLVLDANGSPVFRGQTADIAAFVDGQSQAAAFTSKPVSESTCFEVDAAVYAMAWRDAEDLGAKLVEKQGRDYPNMYGLTGVKVVAPRGSLMTRMLDLLGHPPEGPEKFSPAQNRDHEAHCELAARLCRFMGYQTLVTAMPDGYVIEGLRKSPADSLNWFYGPGFGEALGRFAKSLAQQGWRGDSPVFLCRPMPILSSALGIRAPFEICVQRDVVGTRLPKAMIASALR